MVTMAIRVGIRELRERTGHYLDLVQTGEEVEITDRGKLVAELRAPSKEKLVREQMIKEGRLIPGNGGLSRWRPRRELPEGVESPSQMLMRMREAEREEPKR